MKADQERVKTLLTDTVTLLCKNGLQFSRGLRVEGLLGVSIDDSDVFFVHISEKLGSSSNKSESAEETSDEPINYTPSIKSKKRKLHANSDDRDSSSPLHASSPQQYQHRLSSSPRGSPEYSNKANSGSSVRVKMEPHDEDVICVKKERKELAMSDHEPRVPPLHGDDSGDVVQALRNLQGNFASQTQQMAALYGDNEQNESEMKHPIDDSGGEAFSPGLVRNLQEPPGQVTPGGSQWNNSGLPPDLSANASGLQLDSSDSIPGCSAWPVGPPVPTSQNLSTDSQLTGTMSGVDHGYTEAGLSHSSVQQPSYAQPSYGAGSYFTASGKQHRSRWAKDKTYICGIGGCSKSFFHMPSLCRHRRIVHNNGRRLR